MKYYDYEDIPARIDKNEYAEIYISGKGFIPTSSTKLHFFAYPINRKTFNDMMVQLISRKKHSN